MLFIDISYLELWWQVCLAERNHLCNFGRGHYKKYFCEIGQRFGDVVDPHYIHILRIEVNIKSENERGTV